MHLIQNWKNLDWQTKKSSLLVLYKNAYYEKNCLWLSWSLEPYVSGGTEVKHATYVQMPTQALISTKKNNNFGLKNAQTNKRNGSDKTILSQLLGVGCDSL